MSLEKPVESHLRLVGLMGSLPLFMFMSQTSEVSALLSHEFGISTKDSSQVRSAGCCLIREWAVVGRTVYPVTYAASGKQSPRFGT